MARKPSLDVVKRKNESKVQTPEIGITHEDFERRAEEKKRLPDVDLVQTYECNYRGFVRPVTLDYNTLVAQFPDHNGLIKQLIIGSNLHLRQGCSSTTLRTAYGAIQEFLKFVNSCSNLSNISVKNMSDINITVTKSFVNYLASNFPRRSWNCNRYGAIRLCQRRFDFA